MFCPIIGLNVRLPNLAASMGATLPLQNRHNELPFARQRMTGYPSVGDSWGTTSTSELPTNRPLVPRISSQGTRERSAFTNLLLQFCRPVEYERHCLAAFLDVLTIDEEVPATPLPSSPHPPEAQKHIHCQQLTLTDHAPEVRATRH